MAALAGALGAAPAQAAHVKHHTETVTLPAHATRTYRLVYPDALRYGDQRYSGTVRTLGRGTARVRVLSQGSALGGSELRVRVRNDNRFPVRLRITATTRRP